MFKKMMAIVALSIGMQEVKAGDITSFGPYFEGYILGFMGGATIPAAVVAARYLYYREANDSLIKKVDNVWLFVNEAVTQQGVCNISRAAKSLQIFHLYMHETNKE